MNKTIPLVNISATNYTNKFTELDVATDHIYSYRTRGMDFTKDLKLTGKYCYHPFNTITIDSRGDVYMCICQAWLPISVGKITDFDNFEDIVSSLRARQIQSSIVDGSYRYCDNNTCDLIKQNQLESEIQHRPDTINWINFSIDSSCNLTCPSCRTNFKFLNEGPEYDNRISMVNHIIKLIENHQHWLKFTLAGDGDPFHRDRRRSRHGLILVLYPRP